MRRYLSLPLSLWISSFFVAGLSGQQTVDNSQAATVIPFKMAPNEPGSCHDGEYYINTTTATLRACHPADTWSDATAAGINTLNSAHIYVGSSLNVATDRALTGDIALTNAGVSSIGAGKVTDPMLHAPATSGLGSLRVAHARYDFSVDGGGAPGLITPTLNATLPINAILIGATLNSSTAIDATGGAASITIGTAAGSAANSILTTTAKGSFTTNALVNGVVTLAAPVKMSAAGAITLTSVTNALTSGVLEIFVYYVVSGT